MNGYDAFLARELDDHHRRGDLAEHITDLVNDRAHELSRDAEAFLDWIAERQLFLDEIKIRSVYSGHPISATTALVCAAPGWLAELVLEAGRREGFDSELLQDMHVSQPSWGRAIPADEALIRLAPQWVRDELREWLIKQSPLRKEISQEVKS